MFLSLFAWLFFRQAPGGRQLAGIAIGLTGLTAMAWVSSSGIGFRPLGAVMMLAASALWAGGSLGASRLRLPTDLAISVAAQLLPIGVLLALAAWITGMGASLHPPTVPIRAWGVLTFLIVASTLIGYAVFLALTRSASSALANSFNYVSPVIALVLSAWFPNERVGWAKVFSAGITLAAMVPMVGKEQHTTSAATRPDSEHA